MINKNYTDIEQSEKLAKILPLKSADMCYPLPCKYEDKPLLEQGGFGSIPCWSLDALINVLPADLWDVSKHCYLEILKKQDDKGDESSILYTIRYFYYGKIFDDVNPKPNSDMVTRIASIGSNLIDACVRIIVDLHKEMIYDFNNYKENE